MFFGKRFRCPIAVVVVGGAALILLSVPNSANAWDATSPVTSKTLHRRSLLQKFVAVTAAATTSTATLLVVEQPPSSSLLRVAHAACLPGDLSVDCIGVYKVPIDDAIKDMVGTKEALKQFAPDLNYVPPIGSPKSAKDALESLLAQRKAADDIQNVVASGRLEEAGIKVLNLIPKLTVAGRLLVQERDKQQQTTTSSKETESETTIKQLRQSNLESMFQAAEVDWKNVDITIGQGLRGDLGVSAVAQLQILSEIREAKAALDDFLVAVRQ